MALLSLRRNYLTYRGTFRRPPLVLWGDGAKIFGGLLDALGPFGADLNSISQDAPSEKPSEQGISVTFSPDSKFRFLFSGPQLDLVDFTDETLAAGAQAVQAVEGWLRSVDPDLRYASHSYVYAAHLIGEGLASEDILRAIPSPEISMLGRNRGTALTFHADPTESERIQLTVDHSLVITNGVYVQFLQLMRRDQVDHVAQINVSRGLLRDALGSIGIGVEGWE